MSSRSELGSPGLPAEFALGTGHNGPTANAASGEAIDLSSLLRRCLDDPTFCGMILHKFAVRSVDQVAALQRALESGNMTELAREAHTLQGVAANLSAVELREYANQLEKAAKEDNVEAAANSLEKTVAELERCAELAPDLLERLGL